MTYQKINKISLNLFFLTMLVVPASFQTVRGIMLGIIFAGSVVQLSFKKVLYNKTLLYIAIINILASFLFIYNGVFLSAPGAISVSTVYLIWPILFLYFIGLNYDFQQLKPFISTTLIGGLLAALLLILFIINEFVGVPGISVLADAQGYQAGFYFDLGFIQINSSNLTTIFYLFTFSLTIFSLPDSINPFYRGKGKALVITSLIVSFIVIIISGRRAFWLMCLLSPLIIIVLFKLSKIKLQPISYIIPISLVAILIVIAISFQALSINADFITDRVTNVFEFDDPTSESNYLRKEQSDALINGWKERPILGAGLGATAVGSIRDPNTPWAYELSYWDLLFETGIVGMVIYTASIFWIFIKAIKIMREDQSAVFMLAPQLVGLVTFLMINASNPYLAKFDYLWTLFFPIATLNAYMVTRNLNKAQSLNQLN